MPESRHLEMRALSRLNRAALQLEHAPRSALNAEAFLLPLLAGLQDAGAPLPADAPDWLRETCRAARDPEVFRKGAAGLVALTGLSHPHVSRVMRQYLGQTPSQFINTIRMGYAARALSGTPDSLADIAQAVGLPNLSHFHKLFRAFHGLTPHQYRRRHQTDVLQPKPRAAKT